MTPNAVAVVTPEERAEREREGATLAAYAGALAITEAEAFTGAAQWLQEVALPLKAKIRETFRPRIEQAHALHKGLLADERRFLGPVEDAERVVRGKLAVYEAEQTSLRRDAEAAAQRELERLEAEARAQAEAAQRRLQAEAESRRLEEAAALEARGDRDGAERLIAELVVTPMVMPAPVFTPRPPVAAPPKVEGVSFRDEWRAELVDLSALVRAVAAEHTPLTLLLPNMPALNQMARALKGALAVPGVRAVCRRDLSVKAG